MAEQNGNARAPHGGGPVDLDALVVNVHPQYVCIEGVEYRVRPIIHLTEDEEADLRRLEQRVDEETRAADPDSYSRARRAAFDLAFWLVRSLVPDLPDVVRRRVRLDQAWAIAGVGRRVIAENPPLADTGTASTAAVASSRPVSADSTAPIPATSPA